MAYTLVSSPSNQESIMTALRDFAVSLGWTLDNFTAGTIGVSRGVMSLHNGDCFVSFRWFGTEGIGQEAIAMYQALGYSGGNAATPWLQLDDSGNGTISDSLSLERRVSQIGAGPYLSLHLFGFANDETSGNSAPSIYGVIEFEPGKYRHFGFGTIDKFGDWTGGEWCAGHEWNQFSSDGSNPIDHGHSVLLDGLATDSSGGVADTETGTIHVEGLPGQDVSTKWGQVWNDNSPSTDRALNPRSNIHGPIRANMYTRVFGRFPVSTLTEFVPLMPCPVFYQRDISPPNQRYYLLGYMANIRMVQLGVFNPGEEITIGNIIWKLFPVVAKSNVGGSNQESENMGIAYIKEVV